MEELPPVIVVGNKCDLDESQRCVSKEEGKILTTKLDDNHGLVSFAETSAKNNINVYEVFADLVRRSKAKRQVKPEKNAGGCCCILL